MNLDLCSSTRICAPSETISYVDYLCFFSVYILDTCIQLTCASQRLTLASQNSSSCGHGVDIGMK